MNIGDIEITVAVIETCPEQYEIYNIETKEFSILNYIEWNKLLQSEGMTNPYYGNDCSIDVSEKKFTINDIVWKKRDNEIELRKKKEEKEIINKYKASSYLDKLKQKHIK
jgi:hypothetical protein